MDLQIAGKKALVMSSSQGLGAGIATALAAEGVDILLTGRGEERLKELADRINAAGGGSAGYVIADLADPASVDVLAAAVVEVLGGADILIVNTGGPPPGRMVDADVLTLTAHFDTMVSRVVALAARLVPYMQTRGWGRIVAIGSSGVIQPIPNLGLSNLVRSALLGWSKSLSNDLAGDGITVNMLVPGRIHTERVDQLDEAAGKRSGKTIDEVRAASRATIPKGRYGAIEEFAATAAFLCSEPASYITGSVLRCDGGMIRSV
ncbi:MAG: SDR family oxidoreductase [Aestuariivita sp.]|nr:SDR family oxidoreductase [Litoreibacter sp.]MCY4300494.1 SDR family oxidoreductase [Aestuariivita sp.]